MADQNIFPHFKSVISLDPLLEFWRRTISPGCSDMARMFTDLEARLAERPELLGRIQDPALLTRTVDLWSPLMAVVFPPASWDWELAGAFEPFTLQSFYASPKMAGLLLDENGVMGGFQHQGQAKAARWRALKGYAFILEKFYGLKETISYPLIKVFEDPGTGLEKHFRIDPDLSFLAVETKGAPPELTREQLARIQRNLLDLDLLTELLPPEQFTFSGFVIIRAVDVTTTEVMGRMERQLIDHRSFLTAEGFCQVERHLAVMLEKPDLRLGVAAIKDEDILLLNPREIWEKDTHRQAGCIFSDTRHLPASFFQGSVFEQAVEQKAAVRIDDLSEIKNPTAAEKHALLNGVKSFIVSPLILGEKVVGTLDVGTGQAEALGPMAEELINLVSPMFAMAVSRSLDRLDTQIQGLVKENCTAIHPSVEWRFTQEAYNHLNRLHDGKESVMAPIVFKEVYPLFGSSDIRGSSEARNRAVTADLAEQLDLALKIINQAALARDWPLLSETAHLITGHRDRVSAGVTPADEQDVVEFLQREVESMFGQLHPLNPSVSAAVERYRQALDADLGMIYRYRKQFENSVSKLNSRLSAYLDAEEAAAQQVFPHYFEKHQTDGLDYVIYLGQSMSENGGFSRFFVKNMRLWQLMVAAGIAWHSENLKSETEVALDTCHLILVNDNPLSIRFRYDEKRFDVDGAYDVRHEIIKSRIDKATVRGSRERLTQPGRLAVVYTSPAEAAEMIRHIEYLQSTGYLTDKLERLELEDLPGVNGLKALRVGVDLESGAISRRTERLASYGLFGKKPWTNWTHNQPINHNIDRPSRIYESGAVPVVLKGYEAEKSRPLARQPTKSARWFGLSAN